MGLSRRFLLRAESSSRPLRHLGCRMRMRPRRGHHREQLPRLLRALCAGRVLVQGQGYNCHLSSHTITMVFPPPLPLLHPPLPGHLLRMQTTTVWVRGWRRHPRLHRYRYRHPSKLSTRAGRSPGPQPPLPRLLHIRSLEVLFWNLRMMVAAGRILLIAVATTREERFLSNSSSRHKAQDMGRPSPRQGSVPLLRVGAGEQQRGAAVLVRV